MAVADRCSSRCCRTPPSATSTACSGVPATASTDEITAACRRLARTFHPDHNRSQRATAEMQVVNAVRRVLTDPEPRASTTASAALPRPSGRVAFREPVGRAVRAGALPLPARPRRSSATRGRPSSACAATVVELLPRAARLPGRDHGRR